MQQPLSLTGKIYRILERQGGMSRTGAAWSKQEFVIEIEDGQYPKQVSFALWGDKADILAHLNVGDTVTVSFMPNSREFNGKWYTDLRVINVQAAANDSGYYPDPEPPTMQAPPPTYIGGNSEDTFVDQAASEADDLPF